MNWLLELLFIPLPGSPQHIGGCNTEKERACRIATLSEDEKKTFEWMKAGYTSKWVAETMLLGKKPAKQMFRSVFSKLGVKSPREIIRYYARAPITPADLPPET